MHEGLSYMFIANYNIAVVSIVMVLLVSTISFMMASIIRERKQSGKYTGDLHERIIELESYKDRYIDVTQNFHNLRKDNKGLEQALSAKDLEVRQHQTRMSELNQKLHLLEDSKAKYNKKKQQIIDLKLKNEKIKRRN